MISRDVENTDRIAESSQKKGGIYCITRNVTTFVKFWMNKSKRDLRTLKSKRDMV